MRALDSRFVSLAIGGLALSALLAPPSAAAQDLQSVFEECIAPKTPVAERLAQCSTLIESGRGTPTARAQVFAARGFAYAAQREHAAAVADFDESIRLHPLVVAYEYRAAVHMAQEKPDRALADFASAIKLEPKKPQLYRSRSYIHSQRKDYKRSIADMSTVIKLRDKPDAGDYLLRAIDYERSKQRGKAIADYRKALEIDPDNNYARRFLGGLGGKPPVSAQLPPGKCSAAEQTTSHEDRIKGCTAVIDSRKHKGWTLKTAYCNRAFALTEIREYDRVIQDSNALLKIDANASCAYLNRGRAWYYKHDLDKAIADYNRAIAIEPTFHEAFASRGTAYHDRMEFDRAVADYDVALRIEPSADVKEWRENTLRMKGIYGPALADMGFDTARTPENAERYRMRADVYAARGDLDRAIADFTAAIELEPNESSHLHARAKVYDRTGETALADADRAEADKRQFNRFRALFGQAGKETPAP